MTTPAVPADLSADRDFLARHPDLLRKVAGAVDEAKQRDAAAAAGAAYAQREPERHALLARYQDLASAAFAALASLAEIDAAEHDASALAERLTDHLSPEVALRTARAQLALDEERRREAEAALADAIAEAEERDGEAERRRQAAAAAEARRAELAELTARLDAALTEATALALRMRELTDLRGAEYVLGMAIRRSSFNRIPFLDNAFVDAKFV